MSCQKCPSGRTECGPDPTKLCELGGDPPKTVGRVHHNVWVRRGKKDCEAKVDHPFEDGDGTLYSFYVEVSVREDSGGNCVVGFELKTL